MKVSALISRLLLSSAVACLPVMAAAQSSATEQGTASSKSQMNTEKANSTKQVSDKQFVKKAQEADLAEVELGKLATEKAASEDVKKFGQRMVDDHSKNSEELKQVAETEGIKLPETLDAKDKALKERLSKLNGESFDRVYMENMVRDHKKDVAEFARESRNATDPKVKEFASQTLPTLKEHLQLAESIAPKMKTSSAKKTNETMTK